MSLVAECATVPVVGNGSPREGKGDVLQVWRGRLVGWKDREERNSTGNLQVAADGAGADSV